MTEWFEQWFGKEYLRLYPHRDDADAAKLADLVAAYQPLTGRHVLDLACGPGRHAVQFRLRGARVTGFDLSMPLLDRARHRDSGAAVALVRGDMRHLPFAPRSFDIVVNLFTSFGYFSQDEQHTVVLRGTADVLRAHGTFVLDFLHADTVRQRLIPHEEFELNHRTVAIERAITDDGLYVTKEIHLVDDGRSFVERVRLFTPDELAAMLADAGFVVRHQLGDYEGGPLGPGSPRAIFISERL